MTLSAGGSANKVCNVFLNDAGYSEPSAEHSEHTDNRGACEYDYGVWAEHEGYAPCYTGRVDRDVESIYDPHRKKPEYRPGNNRGYRQEQSL